MQRAPSIIEFLDLSTRKSFLLYGYRSVELDPSASNSSTIARTISGCSQAAAHCLAAVTAQARRAFFDSTVEKYVSEVIQRVPNRGVPSQAQSRRISNVLSGSIAAPSRTAPYRSTKRRVRIASGSNPRSALRRSPSARHADVEGRNLFLGESDFFYKASKGFGRLRIC